MCHPHKVSGAGEQNTVGIREQNHREKQEESGSQESHNPMQQVKNIRWEEWWRVADENRSTHKAQTGAWFWYIVTSKFVQSVNLDLFSAWDSVSTTNLVPISTHSAAVSPSATTPSSAPIWDTRCYLSTNQAIASSKGTNQRRGSVEEYNH